jgi:serine/threonine-protein kinase HipA
MKERRQTMCKCLYCYRPLAEGEKDMHVACIKKFFGTTIMPSLEYTTEQLDELAKKIIQVQTSLTGVQPKLSLHLKDYKGSKRLTIVGLWGGYICKPQTPLYKMMPEVEDLSMHLAELAHIEVVPHTLMRMADNTLCYLTRRIDRTKMGEKLAMEDMCQLTGRQTEHKYKSSYERIGKSVIQYSSVPKMDVTNFFEVVLFSWLTGNNDMHLKNFSLYEPVDNVVRLSPAYDLLNVAIINPKDDEELALTLNGRKKNIKKTDFLKLAQSLEIEPIIVEHLINKYVKLQTTFESTINGSFLDDELKEKYSRLLSERIERILA